MGFSNRHFQSYSIKISHKKRSFQDLVCANFSCGALSELRRSELAEQLIIDARTKSENEACLKILHLLYNLMIK